MNKPMNNVSRALQAAVMLLAIILLAMTVSQATLAEGQTVLIVYGDEDAGNTENLHADWASMIGSAGMLEELRFSGYRKTMDVVVGNNPPDFFMIESRDCIAGFIEKGLVSAFEPTQMMMDDIAAMPTFVQNAIRDNLMTEDGRLYGFPNYINSRESLYYTDAWTDSPFRDMSPPSSFEELLDFVEIYLETPHDGFCFYYDRLGHANVTWFVHMLMEYHTLQCRHAGYEPVFNDPDFIRMAERTRDLFGRLFATEKDTKHQKGHQLFTDCYAGIATNGLDTFTQDNLIPWRIKSDQPPLFPVSIQIYCVRNGSEFVDQAPAFFECIVTHRKDPLSDGNINYASYTLVHPDWVDMKAFRTDKAKMFGEKWVFTCATQEYLDSVWRLDQHAVPALEYEICWDSSIKGAHNEAYAAVDDFVNGKESAEQFSIRLDRLVSEMPGS